MVSQNWNREFSAPLCVCVCVFCLYIRFLALNKKTCVARRSHLFFYLFFFSLTFHLFATSNEFIQEPRELGFTLDPPVVFYSIFILCTILSTESIKQRLTFFRFAELQPRFYVLPEKLVWFRIRLTSCSLLLK